MFTHITSPLRRDKLTRQYGSQRELIAPMLSPLPRRDGPLVAQPDSSYDAYSKLLAKRLRDRDWPKFENGEFFDVLDKLATDADQRSTVDAQLAALLIYHQLAEEMTRLLLEDARLFVQLSVYPAKIQFKDRQRPMMGYWLQLLEATIDFEGKSAFVEKARKLNTLRNKVFHGITKHTSEKSFTKKLRPAANLYNELCDQFDECHDWFYLCFKDFR